MKKRFITNVLFGIVWFLLAAVYPVKAQSNFVLHTFGSYAKYGTGINFVYTNSDGKNPSGWLTLSGTNFYGTTQKGGTNGSGTLFAISTNGTFKLLYTFPYDNQSNGTYNTYGAVPNGGLVLINTNLYGTTSQGGTFDNGVIYSISTNGAGIKVLYTFPDFIDLNTNTYFYTNAGGASPTAGLVFGGGKLYGTAQDGGAGGNGVIFSCTTNSPATFTVLRHFTPGNYDLFGNLTNSDGANPTCQLVLSGTNLFGTTSAGGTNGLGTIFRVSTNGAGFTVLRHFDDNDFNGDHGAQPNAGLVLSGGKLFGMGGTIAYSLGTNGAGFTALHSFSGNVDVSPLITSGLIISNGTLYGVAAQDGANFNGQVFELSTNGVGFADYHDFTSLDKTNSRGYYTNFDGVFPNGAPVFLNGQLYGAANQGGTNGSGILFKASPLPPAPTSWISGTDFTFGFQTFAGQSYTVQKNTNLLSTNWTTFTNITGNSTMRQFLVPATAPEVYYRVRQP